MGGHGTLGNVPAAATAASARAVLCRRCRRDSWHVERPQRWPRMRIVSVAGRGGTRGGGPRALNGHARRLAEDLGDDGRADLDLRQHRQPVGVRHQQAAEEGEQEVEEGVDVRLRLQRVLRRVGSGMLSAPPERVRRARSLSRATRRALPWTPYEAGPLRSLAPEARMHARPARMQA